jgi:hypothetical protein
VFCKVKLAVNSNKLGREISGGRTEVDMGSSASAVDINVRFSMTNDTREDRRTEFLDMSRSRPALHIGVNNDIPICCKVGEGEYTTSFSHAGLEISSILQVDSEGR